MYDVISLGAATVDIFVKSDGFSLQDDKLAITYSSKYEMTDSLICSGGGATNSSVSLSRLGLKTSCVSLLGNDPLSLYVFNDLKENNVSTDNLVHLNKEDTDYSVILVGPDGGRTIVTNRGVSRLENENLNWDKISQTSWFYITSLEGNLDLLEQIIGFATEHQIRVALNPGNRELMDSKRLIPLLSHVDFLLLNGIESETLTGVHVNEGNYWETLLSYGAKISAVTNGRQGAYVLTSEEKLYSPIINTTPVDETGAGDSFGSAFVGGIINRLSPADSLFWAIKNSASVVSGLGAKTGLLTLAEIKQ
ncbi:carbohydrate kinase family protein [Candidatus Shapirobacteria bacterium]|nr:carbohydrate kinase family protein [Candidatus Shapirobacteria bacterium]